MWGLDGFSTNTSNHLLAAGLDRLGQDLTGHTVRTKAPRSHTTARRGPVGVPATPRDVGVITAWKLDYLMIPGWQSRPEPSDTHSQDDFADNWGRYNYICSNPACTCLRWNCDILSGRLKVLRPWERTWGPRRGPLYVSDGHGTGYRWRTKQRGHLDSGGCVASWKWRYNPGRIQICMWPTTRLGECDIWPRPAGAWALPTVARNGGWFGYTPLCSAANGSVLWPLMRPRWSSYRLSFGSIWWDSLVERF